MKNDKIYDFGELGKWSENTLKEHVVRMRYQYADDDDESCYYYTNEFIKSKWSCLANYYSEAISNLERERPAKNISTLANQLNKYNMLKEKRANLYDDYKREKEVCEKLYKRRK